MSYSIKQFSRFKGFVVKYLGKLFKKTESIYDCDYFFSTSGNDSNDGLSPLSA